MKKIISLMLVFALAATQIKFITELFPKASAAVDFSCGHNLTWYLDTDKRILTISGTGYMENYSYLNSAPWLEYRQNINYLVVEEGVTGLGDYAFEDLTLVTVTLPSSLEEIGLGAFSGTGNVFDIIVPENSKLRYCCDTGLEQTYWYSKKSKGEVYLGDMLFKYKGTLPENTVYEIKEGTSSINAYAFSGQKNLIGVTVPDSVKYIGKYAFEKTPFYETFPDGAVYIGNILYSYKSVVDIEETDFYIREGTVSISENAFGMKSIITNIFIPATVEYIGDWAFNHCVNVKKVIFAEGSVLSRVGFMAFGSCQKLCDINLPESLEFIEGQAFYDCDVEEFYIPEKVKEIGASAFGEAEIKRFVVNENNEYFSADNYGILYNINKTILERAPVKIQNKNVVLPDTVTFIRSRAFYKVSCDRIVLPESLTKMAREAFYFCLSKEVVFSESISVIEKGAFSSCNLLTKVVLPHTVTAIRENAFIDCYFLTSIVIPRETVEISGNPFSKRSGEPLMIYCYENSQAHVFSEKNEIPFILLDYIDEVVTTEALIKIMEESQSINRELYTEDSLMNLDEALSAVDLETEKLTQAQVDRWESHIRKALDSLVNKPADYTAVEKAKKSAGEIDRKLYTPQSLFNLDSAVAVINYELDITKQTMVDSYAEAIYEAIEALVYLPADYTNVNAAKERAMLVDRTLYTSESLAVLDNAVAAVDETLDLSNQDKVEAYAKAINDAIDNLEYLPADYTRVNEAVAESEKLDRILYSQATLEILDQSISGVDYTLNIIQQSIVDGLADRIYSAISGLKYAEVVLRNEPNGVIVSATAKEIYPTTALTVDMLDPSNYETANFAVGGNIKSVQYYDINLIREGEKIQPEGSVYVKIRIPDGVKPERCRVYHVTEDPVDPLVRFSSALDGNYIVFETDHFSEFAVIEVETYLSGISITKMPSKLTYGLNEKTDFSDMQVTAIYSDGKSELITGYDISNVDTSSVGTKTATVYYTFGEITKSVSFEITVTADKITADITLNGKSINEYNKRVAWYKGYSSESVQFGCDLPYPENCTVRWSSDNSKVLVDDNGKVTNKGFFFPRKATVSVTVTDSAGNVIATDSITVRFYKFGFQLSGIQTVFQSLKRNSIFLFL